MKKNGKSALYKGGILVAGFAIWTILIQIVDVKPIGQNGTTIGFASFNIWFHNLTGVHMEIYTITDWMGLIPLFICLMFGFMGVGQLVKRKSLLKVDYDIILLGVYYIVIILAYLMFEIIPINYRPILINGVMESSYPSSTTLLVLSVMPTLVFQVKYRVKNILIKNILSCLTGLLSVFMVLGRWICGVHWFTDIVGSVMLSTGLFYIYKALVLLLDKKEN